MTEFERSVVRLIELYRGIQGSGYESEARWALVDDRLARLSWLLEQEQVQGRWVRPRVVL